MKLNTLKEMIEHDQILDTIEKHVDAALNGLRTSQANIVKDNLLSIKELLRSNIAGGVDSGIPHDMGNRLPTGGRSGNHKIDKFQGYKISPMYGG